MDGRSEACARMNVTEARARLWQGLAPGPAKEISGQGRAAGRAAPRYGGNVDRMVFIWVFISPIYFYFLPVSSSRLALAMKVIMAGTVSREKAVHHSEICEQHSSTCPSISVF